MITTGDNIKGGYHPKAHWRKNYGIKNKRKYKYQKQFIKKIREIYRHYQLPMRQIPTPRFPVGGL